MNSQLNALIASINNNELSNIKEPYLYLKQNSIIADNPIENRYLDIVRKYSYDQFIELVNKEIILSFTTFPERIKTINKIIDNINNQTKKPSKIILWLAEDEFPNKEKDLPQDLINNDSVIIRFTNNLKSHKKYLYSMKEFTDSIIVTIDDDLIYPNNMIEMLFLSYLEYPEAISASRVHIMIIDEENNKILPYNDWIYESNYLLNKPSMQLYATTGAGTLYPPNIIPEEFLDEELIKQLCPTADDMYLKIIEVLNDIPVVLAYPFDTIKTIPNTQDNSLYKHNNKKNGNDIQLSNLIKWTDDKYETNYVVNKLVNNNYINLLDKGELLNILIYYGNKDGITNKKILLSKKDKEIKELKAKYNNIVNSKLYKILSKLRKLKNSFKQSRQ